MSQNEILAIIVGGLAGYWGVLKLLGRSRSSPENPTGAGPQDASDDRPFFIDESDSPGAHHGTSRAPVAAPWWEVLQVDRMASTDDIQRAYKRLLGEYHPDKVASLGEELRALAEAKSKAINRAYDEAMQARK